MLDIFLGISFCTQWKPREDINKMLPSSIKVYQFLTTNSSFNTKLSGFRADINISDPNLQIKMAITQGHLKTPVQFAAQQPNVVYAVINGGYFNMQQNFSVSYLATNGIVKAKNQWHVSATHFPTAGSFGITKDGKISGEYNYVYDDNSTYSFDIPNTVPGPQPKKQNGKLWNVKQGIGAGPLLIKNSNILDITKQGWTSQDARNPRSAVCIKNNGQLVLLAVDGRTNITQGLYLKEQAIMLKQLDCKDALNLDGGGSTLLWAGGKIINHPSDLTGPRPVTTVLLIIDKNKKKQQFQLKQ